MAGRMTLYDIPVSINGARNRYIIRKKGLESEMDIVRLQTIGGPKSPQYLALNSQVKMPLLIREDGTPLPGRGVRRPGACCPAAHLSILAKGGKVISQYLMDKFASRGESLVAATPEARVKEIRTDKGTVNMDGLKVSIHAILLHSEKY
ncbi:hypothetical protein VaNZ11_000843 [Volvox africanus]|uniref:GST N-terminal domain-containing protein n=1 Tax=Volvox africanus TaxID=51714 RepID=A0ABQ5RNY9_9CHLO|nr:hypothetical protein VaNZ11_000843 [Volvox africanus]